MPLVGLSEAARLARKDKSTIHRALQTGRLSYTITEAGERRIDTAELDRVFPLFRANGGSEGAQPVAQRRRDTEHMQRLLDDRDATIRDLRQRLGRTARRAGATHCVIGCTPEASRTGSATPAGPPHPRLVRPPVTDDKVQIIVPNSGVWGQPLRQL
jgi:hypothetical protein